MDNTILISILSMAGLGLFFAVVLAIVNQKLKIKEDPLVEKLEGVLPRLNCGACGFANCHIYAEKLAKKEVSPNQCRAGGEEVTNKISEILGVSAERPEKKAGIVHCGADASKRKKKAVYTGIKTCIAAHATSGGEIFCEYGCLGYGDCMRACPFGGIEIVNGLAKINPDICTACGKCATACPRGLITVEKITSKDFIYVACSNLDKGADTRKVCPVGCIACGICQKLTEGIFHVEGNLSRVDYEKLTGLSNTDEVVKKCPTKCIVHI